MKFKDMEYNRPDVELVMGKIDNIKDEIEKSKSSEEQFEKILEFDKFNIDIETDVEIAQIRHSINTKDDFYSKENDFFDENLPLIEARNNEVYEKIVKSQYREELEKKVGKHYFDLLECGLVINEKAIPFMQKENELISKYEKLIANSKINLNGNVYTITQMTPFLESKNRLERKEALDALYGFFDEKEAEIDAIYDEMVKVRHEMAVALGYKNYVDLRYRILKRTDYNSSDVKKYREKVRNVITPLAVKLRKEQAKRIGVEDFKFYDRPHKFADGNSKPHGDSEFIIKNAQKMYRELSEETGEFFDFMVENELMDLLAKPGKRAGGYCTSLSKYGAPFIFSNFNGTNGDIDVITHEAGHAFQIYMSQGKVLSQYLWPTYEACEIHSMSMEFLTWPWMDLFFEEEADKFRYSALFNAITFIPYGVTIDHFQEFVYENPEATPEERKTKYRELELMYQPDLDYENEFLNKGTYWYKQGHVFASPFYYIDYTLAQVCAFQFLIRSLENKDKALEDYMKICKIGGELPFFKIMESGNLENPMTTDIMEKSVNKLEEILNKLSFNIENK